jgi:hypothetical protein
MLKYIILFFSVSLFLCACNGNKNANGIIDQHTMVGLLTEVHIVDGGLYSVAQTPDSLQKYGAAKYLSLFNKYHTDSLQFRKSLQYYTKQPTVLLAIYDEVLKNLKKKADSLNNILVKKNAVSR